MMRRIITLLLVIFCLSFPGLSHASQIKMVPKAILVLPENSLVKVKWLIPPQGFDRYQDQKNSSIGFFIDSKGKPILLYENKILFNPEAGYIIRISQEIKDIICLENGVLILSDRENIGYLKVDKSSEFIPQGRISVIAKIPFPDSKIFSGNNTLYSVGFNNKTKKYEVYIFDSRKKIFRKLFSLNEPVAALTGKNEHIFFAQGRLIREYKNGQLSDVYEHPSQDIKEIFFNDKTGLIYKTSKGVGIVKDNAALEFLQTENPVIFLKGTTIYVLFNYLSGILEIENIDDLKSYNFKVEKIIDIQQTL